MRPAFVEWLSAFVLVCVTFAGCTGGVQPPPRPENVPSSAVWAGAEDGGSWIECEEPEDTTVVCRVYHESLGEIEAEGIFGLKGGGTIHRSDLVFEGADVDSIYLRDGRVLVPRAVRCPILGTKASEWLGVLQEGGYWIECEDYTEATVSCGVSDFDKNPGRTLAYGLFGLKGGGKTQGSELVFDDFDGRSIYLRDGRVLVPRAVRYPVLGTDASEWVGVQGDGSWIECRDYTEATLFCQVFDKNRGQILAYGLFGLKGGGKTQGSYLDFESFDGSSIHLRDGRVLVPTHVNYPLKR